MIKRETDLTRPIRRINLSLPIVRTDSYEIYSTERTQSSPNECLLSSQKPLYQKNNKTNNQTTRMRSLAHLKNLTGSMLVSLCFDMPVMPTDSSAAMTDTISNALINSGYSEKTLRAVPSMAKHLSRQCDKDDGGRSRTPSVDKLLFDSVESFDDCLISKVNDSMWPNIHHPQLTKSEVLHRRKTFQRISTSHDTFLRAPHTSSLENLSHGSPRSPNERLHKRIERITKNHFPTIQQLRHAHPCPELINNRMHLHREEKRDFVPKMSHSRVLR